jgi:hypothetical protein
MFVIRSRVFRFSNPFHALASVNHFDWQYIFALQEEGLASPENMEMDAALLPNFMESDTYQFLWLILFFLGTPPKKRIGVRNWRTETMLGLPKGAHMTFGEAYSWRNDTCTCCVHRNRFGQPAI